MLTTSSSVLLCILSGITAKPIHNRGDFASTVREFRLSKCSILSSKMLFHPPPFFSLLTLSIYVIFNFLLLLLFFKSECSLLHFSPILFSPEWDSIVVDLGFRLIFQKQNLMSLHINYSKYSHLRLNIPMFKVKILI